jgi:tRNA(fMet)-specific endonuclease VapC
MHVLDTDICIYAMEGRSPSVVARLRGIPRTSVAVTSITVAELRYGAIRSKRPQENAERLARFLSPMPVLTFDYEATGQYAVVKHALALKGELIGPMDTLIAAIALANGATLVTNNVREFSRVPGLLLENWVAPAT